MNLDPQTLFLVQALLVTAREMRSLALNRCTVPPYGPNDDRLMRWMDDVRSGDLVVEASALGLHPQCMGRLLHVEQGGGEFDMPIYFVVGIDGEVMRWENCSFFRIPDPFGYPRHDQDRPDWQWKTKAQTGPWSRKPEASEVQSVG